MKINVCYRAARSLSGVLLLTLFFFDTTVAQGVEDQGSDLIITREIVRSDILREERPILVRLPRGYEQSDSQYPVLFILDAEHDEHFKRSVDITKSLADSGEIPRMIIVGVENTNRLRDMNVPAFEYRGESIVGGADNFLKFIEEELVTFIDDNYRTAHSRILFGASASATFSIFTMVSYPAVFDAYIASSPSFFVNYEIINSNTRKFFASQKHHNQLFFMNLGTEDITKRVTQTKAYAALIKQLAPIEFKWELRVMDGDGHVPETSLKDGLEMIFAQTNTN